jgi:hypothetical protein
LVEFWLGGGGSPVERRRSMKRAFVLDIPHTLEAACDPRRLALLNGRLGGNPAPAP